MKTLLTILLIFCTSIFSFGACPTDSIPPDPIIVDSVSVDISTGNAVIGWQPSTAPDVLLYYIFIIDDITGANVLIDSVYANQSTVYTYSGSNANVTIENLAVGVKDSCENESLTVLDYHNTILADHTIDICSASATLTWNVYDDFQSGLNVGYEVFMSTNSGGYINVGTTSDLEFTYEGLQQGSNYEFIIQAIENGGAGPIRSTSNVVEVTGDFLIDPNYLYLYTATVRDSMTNQVSFYVDTVADTKEYIIKRALAGHHVFTTIASVPDVTGMNPMVTYTDNSVDAKNNAYHYKVDAINHCGQRRTTSNEGKTVNLFVSAEELGGTNSLKWNAYEGWIGGDSRYEVYRMIVGATSYELIHSMSATGDSLYSFEDDVSRIIEGTGEFCYKIRAIEGNGNRIDNLPNADSWSNDYCVIHNPVIFIANAFNPIGLTNPTFKPSAIFFDYDTYSFMIFDRWGKIVFETADRDEAWNGKFNNSGADLPTGSYVYMLKLNAATGEEYLKRGTVTIVK